MTRLMDRLVSQSRGPVCAVAMLGVVLCSGKVLTPIRSVTSPPYLDHLLIEFRGKAGPGGPSRLPTAEERGYLLAQLTSDAVLNAALGSRHLKSIPSIHGASDPVNALRAQARRGTVTAPTDPISVACLSARSDSGSEAAAIIWAISDSIRCRGPNGLVVLGRPSA